MITFERTYPNLGYNVFLNKKKVGIIKRVNSGWQYFPKGSKVGGEIFKYLVDCERSVIGDGEE